MSAAAIQPEALAMHRAARDHCRRSFPDLFFAGYFLPRPQRQTVFCVHAVFHQLLDVMMPRPTEGTCGGSVDGAGGCSTCGGETPEQRREVCSAVLDFLFSGQKTGKPELDGFHDIVRHRRLTREPFDRFADGLKTYTTLRRYATWGRLRSLCQDTVGSATQVAFHVLRDENETPLPEQVTAQVLAWGAAFQLGAALLRVPDDWRCGRLLIPQEDLLKFGLQDRDMAGLLEGDSVNGTASTDLRWQELMRFEAARVRNLYKGGYEALHLLPPPARRAAAVFGEIRMGQLDRFERADFNPFHIPGPVTLWKRLSRLPAAMAKR